MYHSFNFIDMAIFLSTIPSLSTSLKVDSAVYRIKFVPRTNPYTGGLYATSDEKLIEAMRNHPYFGDVITEKYEPKVEVQELNKVYEKSYTHVKKSQEAREILIKKYGVSSAELTSKSSIKEAAERLNIEFPNL